MHDGPLIDGLQITKPIPYTASGGTTLTGTVDMLGFDGCIFAGEIATANAGNYLKVGQGAAADGSDAVDLLGSKVVALVNANVVGIDIFKPRKGASGLNPRYLTVSIVRGGANTVVGGIIAIRYHARKRPTTNTVANVADTKVLVSPAEGAA